MYFSDKTIKIQGVRNNYLVDSTKRFLKMF
jgi:hypothetical protein